MKDLSPVITILLLLFVLSAADAAAAQLRTYQDSGHRLHFTDRAPTAAHTFALFDASVLDEQPLVAADFAADAAPSTRPEAAGFAAKAAADHPVKTVLIDSAGPAILYQPGVELKRGQSIKRPARTRRPGDLTRLIRHHAAQAGLDSRLAWAVAKVESNLNPRAVSSKGAMGVMQLMPHTARELGVKNPFDAEQSIAGGIRYLKQQLDRFGSVELALAAYNAGPDAVERYQGVPPYPETRDYIRKIKHLLASADLG